MSTSDAIFDAYADFMNHFVFYTLINIYRSESNARVCLDALVDVLLHDIVAIGTRASVVVSDILVIVATWYYISHTSSLRTQLVHNMCT